VGQFVGCLQGHLREDDRGQRNAWVTDEMGTTPGGTPEAKAAAWIMPDAEG